MNESRPGLARSGQLLLEQRLRYFCAKIIRINVKLKLGEKFPVSGSNFVQYKGTHIYTMVCQSNALTTPSGMRLYFVELDFQT